MAVLVSILPSVRPTEDVLSYSLHLPDKYRGNTLNRSATLIYSAVQVYYAQILRDHASNNLPNLRACLTLNLLTTTIVAPPSNASKWQMGFNLAFKGLNTGMELMSTQVAAELLEHLIVPSAFVYSRLFNNSSVANGSVLLFHFYILLLFKKRREGKCRVLLSYHVYV